MGKINVVINGKEQEIEENSTISDVIESLNVTSTMFVVEKNLEIVPQSRYMENLAHGDKIEVVGFFGGG